MVLNRCPAICRPNRRFHYQECMSLMEAVRGDPLEGTPKLSCPITVGFECVERVGGYLIYTSRTLEMPRDPNKGFCRTPVIRRVGS
uniref:Uncharacterized protein n=1 Tax=Vespula pensylvanica TaxID=30213 RepID=A0A834U9F0_VESPE|nr:hypothetical protein H0235_008784 [Vespula pensylvanica]